MTCIFGSREVSSLHTIFGAHVPLVCPGLTALIALSKPSPNPADMDEYSAAGSGRTPCHRAFVSRRRGPLPVPREGDRGRAGHVARHDLAAVLLDAAELLDYLRQAIAVGHSKARD